MAPKALAVLIISEYLLLAAMYALGADYRRATYWGAAAVLTVCVTF